ncbi:MAG: tetratricopeptide repeat protein [Chitinophagaceae bacterium]|nr:tetratricopeptide repeat protein [Chitinophagaceae bacterium]
MTHRPHYIKTDCKNLLLLLLFLAISLLGFAQRSKIDSLRSLLATEKTDSNRVKLMWQLARDIGIYNPDTAQVLSQQALYLARNIGYLEGESRSLGVLANTLSKIGNYPRALELNIQKLKLEEKRNVPRNFASVLMNIGVVYVLQDEYRKALEYYSKADSVIQRHNIDDLKYYITLNIGDVYNRLNISDSAFTFFNKSLELARKLDDGDLIGTSMTGLGHSYLKLGSYQQSLINYQTGIGLLKAANDDEILCEAALGIANLYEHLNNYDSAGYYATMSLAIAKQDGFLSKELEAAEFLTEHYKKIKSIDSAFIYVSYVRGLNDSVNSKSKIRESQVISSNEQYRQLEMEEIKRLEKEERFQQLQMLLIAIFIPGFFLLTLLLSRINVPIKLIRLLGVISLLFLFEYLTLLLHPTVAKLTHHTPIYEILIFVGVAALLIPMHHRLEHWLIHKLTHHRHGQKVKSAPASR